MPPIEKIHEAMSALADDRVDLKEDSATVRSSSGEKEYSVKFKNNFYSSDDKGTFWQGYAGYPIIAVLMLQEKLPQRPDLCQHFAGINWTELNKKHKGNYSAAADEIIDALSQKGINTEEIKDYISETYSQLEKMDITVKRKI